MKTKLKAFNNSKVVKSKYVKRIVCHRKADELIHGTYWENGKGCAIGCILHSANHSCFVNELGLPEWLAHLVDFLFEGLENGKAKEFPEQVLKSIKVGVNLDLTYHKFCLFLLREICKNTDNPIVKPSIDKIIELHTKVLTFRKVDENDWSAAGSAASAAGSAASAAASAAWSAAWSAAASAAGSAARSAASAARSAAGSAAWSAAASAAWSAAGSAAIQKIADKLIELLKEAN